MQQTSLEGSGVYEPWHCVSVPEREVPVAFAVLPFVRGPEEWLGPERGATVEFASQHGASSWRTTRGDNRHVTGQNNKHSAVSANEKKAHARTHAHTHKAMVEYHCRPRCT